MGVTAEVLENLLGSTKRGLGGYDPGAEFERGQVAGECGRVGQTRQIAEELQLAGGVSLFESVQEEVAEAGAEHPHGQQEAGEGGRVGQTRRIAEELQLAALSDPAT